MSNKKKIFSKERICSTAIQCSTLFLTMLSCGYDEGLVLKRGLLDLNFESNKAMPDALRISAIHGVSTIASYTFAKNVPSEYGFNALFNFIGGLVVYGDHWAGADVVGLNTAFNFANKIVGDSLAGIICAEE